MEASAILYFAGYHDAEESWTGSFSRAVRRELLRLHVQFTELPPYDWRGAAAPYKHYLRVTSSEEDAWFIGWAQSELIELVAHKKGRKYGLVVGLTAGHLDPLIFSLDKEELRERKRLALYDKLFANSDWCRNCISRAYPELADRVVVTGFPFDFRALQPYLRFPKEKPLVVFNQRFALEKLHILEIEAAHLLSQCGFRVQHLSGIPEARLIAGNPSLAPLLAAAREKGLEFIYNKDKQSYLQSLAKARVVVTTSIADMLPVSLIEAIYLGAVPAAPRALCFPEFVHPDNLYTPYALTEIVDIAARQPVRYHPIEKYAKEVVVERMLAEMGVK
ncbi:MAG: hypothetical protein KGZ57_01570 [Dethiobacter sp.]|nr:hypothetical protein [Dethiobacter sp.]MCL5982962.1 hypothetical protein [Bacillota bacterium]